MRSKPSDRFCPILLSAFGLALVTLMVGCREKDIDENEPNGLASRDSIGLASRKAWFVSRPVVAADGTELEEDIISGPPKPPMGFEEERAAIEPDLAGATKSLAVPAYNWVFGCSAVSGAMIAAYYDRNGYPNMYVGPSNGGVAPLDNSGWPTWSDGDSTYPNMPLIASHQGVDGRTTKGSIDDYWVLYGSSLSDPYLAADAGWSQHAWETAIGDYMKTSQSGFSNTDGSTTFYNYSTSATPLTCTAMASAGISTKDGTFGRMLFYQARGYTVTDCYNQKTDNTIAGGFSFAQYKAEIDAGNPVLLNLQGHSIVGVGYDDSTNTVYLNDTWDYLTHRMTWGGSYSSMGLLSVSIVHLAPASVVAPTGVAASDGAFTDKVRVSWNASSNATSYQVYRSSGNSTDGVIQIGNPNSSPYEDTTAAAGTTYFYFVKACSGSSCSGFSASDSGYRAMSTTGVSASDGTYADRVRVSWSESSGATSYRVYRNTSDSSGSATQIGTPNASPYDDITASVGTTYYYFVKACNDVFCGEFSASDAGYRSGVPANDDVSAATSMTAVPFNNQIDTTYATTAGGDPALTRCSRPAGAQSVWYTFTPSTSRSVFLDTFGSSYDTMIGVFTGNPGSLSLLACNDDDSRSPSGLNSAIPLDVTAGTKYYVVVYGFSGVKPAAPGVLGVEGEVQFAGKPDACGDNQGEIKIGASATPGTTNADAGTKTLMFHMTSFYDVPGSHPLWRYVEGFYNAKITSGCGTSPVRYCPEREVTRAEIAVFLLRAKHGGTWQPPNAPTGVFSDVPITGKEWMQPWMEAFYADGVTGGCATNPLRYCPERSTTRAEISVFVLRSSHGATYQPPSPSSPGVFSDLPVAGKEWMQAWAEQFYREGITSGCVSSPLQYCPERPANRAEMATFISRAYAFAPLP